MQKLRLSSLLFAVLASFSLAATAAEAPKTESAKPAAVQVAQVTVVNLNRRCCNTAARTGGDWCDQGAGDCGLP